MNFTDFSFWWTLFVASSIFWLVIPVAKKFKLWRDSYDRWTLMILSLLLFFNASALSFSIFCLEFLFNYAMIRKMLHYYDGRAKAIAVCVICVDILVLVYFKYFSFFVGNLVGFLLPQNAEHIYKNISLQSARGIPPGISFYTFQMIGFTVDTLKFRPSQTLRFVDYVNFISFFPQIVAGPIERRKDLFPQIESFRFRFTMDNIEAGLNFLIFGMFLKFVLADNISPYIDIKETQNVFAVWLSIYLFGLKIYFDFAGYSFIAVGIARVLGVVLQFNFLAPYTSLNIQEFWRRWHVTLSRWFRDYLYIPLGGGRVKWVSLNILVVLSLCGLWHGAGWNYVLWGTYHGLLLVLNRYLRRFPHSFSIPNILKWALTFLSVMFGWLFFMETNFKLLSSKLHTVFNPYAYSFRSLFAVFQGMSLPEKSTLFFILFLSNAILVTEHIAVWKKQKFVYKWFLSPVVSRILLVSIFLLSARVVKEFVYFAF